MLNLSVEKTPGSIFGIAPMSIKRDWMDVTADKHAYRCFPVTQANMVGWNIFCEKDIRFIWNGINDQSPDTVTILEGSDASYTGRGQSTVSFMTGLVFRSDENISLLSINPTNYFSNDFETMSSLISTSWYDNPLPLAIKAKEANREIVIKAGQPIATLLPISLGALDNTCIEVIDYVDINNQRSKASQEYGQEAQKVNSSGKWTDWYRDAINEKGESLGMHETKALRLSVIDKTKNKGNGII